MKPGGLRKFNMPQTLSRNGLISAGKRMRQVRYLLCKIQLDAPSQGPVVVGQHLCDLAFLNFASQLPCLPHLSPSPGFNQKTFSPWLTTNNKWDHSTLKHEDAEDGRTHTFAFYDDGNLDFVVILHELVQLHGLLPMESQRLNVT